GDRGAAARAAGAAGGGVMRWWVFWRRPGLMHLHAREYGGQSCGSQAAAWALIREKVAAGFVVEVYTSKEPAPQ
ncbi:MAG: hypothetical protein ACTHMP_13155, partial [Thermomicrobiales bacterium]